ncbi:MAG: LemA family protein [Burkholderiaceae bacterium]
MEDAAAFWSGWAPSLLKLGAAAVLLFWVVGAYNRLTRLRGAIGSAWSQIDELLARRATVIDALGGALREPLADEATTLAALAQAEQHQRSAALAVRARPAHAAALMAWVVAEAELASPLARLQALLEQRPGLAGSEQVQPWRQQLAEFAPRLVYARQAFSDAARAYSDALEEFPTRWVARLFSMRPTPGL